MRTYSHEIIEVPAGALSLPDKAVKALEGIGYDIASARDGLRDARQLHDDDGVCFFGTLVREKSAKMLPYLWALADVGVIAPSEITGMRVYFLRLGRRLYEDRIGGES